ncbi:MAG: oxalurate catabolism protein HpxZ [Gammaproteobacteria bacterium]
MIVNDPTTLGEVTAAFERYEKALMENDVAALDAMFWVSPLTLRYGVGENLYGFAAIQEFRKARAGGSPQRTLRNTVITTYGTHFGTASTEFLRASSTRIGRQSQSWALMPEGWRIVSAHVSMMAEHS